MPGQNNISVRTFRPSDLGAVKGLIHRTIDVCYPGAYPKEAVQGDLVEQSSWKAGESYMEQYRVDFDSLPWEAPAAGVRFRACERDGRRLRLAEFTKEFVEPDWCTSGHIGYILNGRIEIDFDGNVIVFGAGDGLFIPAGREHRHKARVLTDTVQMVLVEDM